MKNSRIAIIGVGYVGLQNAIAFSKAGMDVIAYDQDKKRIKELSQGIDRNQEAFDFNLPNLLFTSNANQLSTANHYLISIPTAVNEHLTPIMSPLKSAAQEVGRFLKKEDLVILESTVYPGATRDLLIPYLESQSKLTSGRDFFVGFSSERINPGDKCHTLEKNYKVVSGQNRKALNKVKQLYKNIPKIKIHCASSLEVAESSKLLENIQRDVNIALMNEFSLIMEKLGISIYDVLAAAQTKWNFLPFKPGLVGGHCIPEDPYYLIYQANKLGLFTNLIAWSRQTNEQFVDFIVSVCIKLFTQKQGVPNAAKVAILGVSFKENVSDTRHSLSIVLHQKLKEMGFKVVLCDPIAHSSLKEFQWVSLNRLKKYHCIILTKEHNEFLKIKASQYSNHLMRQGLFMDIPGAFIEQKMDFRKDINYWSL